jgi:DNA (cytosine-5)-methyltransferase 1
MALTQPSEGSLEEVDSTDDDEGRAVPAAARPSKFGVRLVRTDRLTLERHPDSVDQGDWTDWAKRLSCPKAVDLFCGAGGMSLGLEEAGYAVVLGVDHDDVGAETYAANFAGATLLMDLADDRDVETVCELLGRIGDIDLIAGGPPCQPFSRAGRSKIRDLVRSGVREAHDHRRELWQSFVEVVGCVQPRAVLFENVPDMALQDDLSVIRRIAHRLDELGYETDFRLIDAWLHGVPQFRQRFFLVAIRDGHFDWPEPVEPVTLRDAIADLPSLGEDTGQRKMRYRRKPRTALQQWARQGVAQSGIIHDHLSRPVREDDRRAFSLMTSTSLYSDLPEDLQRYRSDIFVDKYKKLAWDEPCRTITAHIAKDGYWYIHPEELRTLSVREAARVQTFPDRFRFAGTRSHAFAQIGNAVPPLLAKALGSAILRAQEQSRPPERIGDRERWATIRNLLLEWGKGTDVAGAWQLSGDPWQVLVGTALTSSSRGTRPTTSRFLERFPTPDAVSGAKAHALSLGADSRQRGEAVMRLARAARHFSTKGWEDDGWSDAAGLTGNEAQQVRTLGLGDDRMVITAGTTRVVSRLAGAPEAQERKLTQGRLTLAHLLGSGDEVTKVNAALVLLGSAVCTATAPRCGSCPLRSFCQAAASLAG